MLEVNIYKSKHTITNVRSRCSGKGSPWEHQGHGIDSHEQQLYFGTFQIEFDDLWDLLWLILCGCACAEIVLK
jgi:hypothetical protein